MSTEIVVEEKRTPWWLVLVVFIALLPLTAITAVTIWLLGRFARFRAVSILAITSIMLTITLFTVGLPDIPAIGEKITTGLSVFPDFSQAAQLILTAGGVWAILLGAILGSALLWWTQRDAENLRMNIWSAIQAQTLQRRIRKGKAFTRGITLGVEANTPNKRVSVSARTSNGHILTTGSTGAGKTQGVLSMLVDSAAQGDAIVYLDLKGGPTVPDFLAGLAEQYGRTFRHFAIFDGDYVGPSETGAATYNPAGYGDATRRKDLLTKSCGSEVEFYRNMTSDYVQVAFAVLLACDGLEGKAAVGEVSQVMEPERLLAKARSIPSGHKDAERLQQACRTFMEQKKQREFASSLKTFETYLSLFTNSVIGPFISADEGTGIDFRRVDEEKEIVCFSLNSSLYGELAGRIATLVVEDITTFAGARFGQNTAPFRLVVDEFAVVDSANILGLISRGREAGMNIVLATQTLADLLDKSEAFKGQVIDNVAGFVVFRANSEADARTYSGLTGDRDAIETGGYGVPWQDFQMLERGECYFIDKVAEANRKGERALTTRTTVVMREVPAVPEFEVEAPVRVANEPEQVLSEFAGLSVQTPLVVEPEVLNEEVEVIESSADHLKVEAPLFVGLTAPKPVEQKPTSQLTPAPQRRLKRPIS